MLMFKPELHAEHYRKTFEEVLTDAEVAGIIEKIGATECANPVEQISKKKGRK